MEAMKSQAVADATSALLQKAQSYWLANFFSNAYAGTDKPNPGAVDYVNKLHDLGANIVYLPDLADKMLTFSVTDKSVEQILDAIVKDYAGHSALAGYFLTDEPGAP